MNRSNCYLLLGKTHNSGQLICSFRRTIEASFASKDEIPDDQLVVSDIPPTTTV